MSVKINKYDSMSTSTTESALPPGTALVHSPSHSKRPRSRNSSTASTSSASSSSSTNSSRTSSSTTSPCISNSTSSDEDDDTEAAEICGTRIQLPQGLCERESLFRDIFNADLWRSLPENQKDQLLKLLPTFPGSVDEQRLHTARTLDMLFKWAPFRFGVSPLAQFHQHLRSGYFRPDIASMRSVIRKLERREHRLRHLRHREMLKNDVQESQQRLLRQIRNLPPGVEPRMFDALTSSTTIPPAVLQHLKGNNIRSINGYTDSELLLHRTRRRYFQTLASIQAQLHKDGADELSADENYPEGPPAPLTRKNRRHLNTIRAAALQDRDLQPQPELIHSNGLDLERYITPNWNPFSISEEHYKALLLIHKRKRSPPGLHNGYFEAIDPVNEDNHEGDDDPELDTSAISIHDVIRRIKLRYTKGSSIATTLTNHGVVAKSVISGLSAGAQLNPSFRKRPKKEEPIIRAASVNSSPSDSETIDTNISSDMVPIKRLKSNQRIPIAKVPPTPASPPKTTAPPVISTKSTSNNRKMDAIVTDVTTKTPITSSLRTVGYGKMVPATLSDLDGIDMMNIPIELAPPSNDLSPIAEVLAQPITSIISTISPTFTTVAASTKFTTTITAANTTATVTASTVVANSTPTCTIPKIDIHYAMQQSTHLHFFAVLRDLFCSTPDHRMDLHTLQEGLMQWQANPISALNDWYHQANSWLAQLPCAMNFLCGAPILGDEYTLAVQQKLKDFVPYVEYKPAINSFQWIGAGRDSDLQLQPLYRFWIEHNPCIMTTPITRTSTPNSCSGPAKTAPSAMVVTTATITSPANQELKVISLDPPPPPRCPTTWVVRKATAEEVQEFREQERQRYNNPHKAFTYRCHGYECVVGPLKGIYSNSLGLQSVSTTTALPGGIGATTKARGHTMLCADRPNFVTILSLVRDAIARLPNGEGTRADICELLKSSQYISNTAPDNVLQSVVSGALDRIHSQYDPCVKYDSKRKIWIYLHRNRSEEDFERIHHENQSLNVKGIGGQLGSSVNRKTKHKIELSEVSTSVGGGGSAAPPPSKRANFVKIISSGVATLNKSKQSPCKPSALTTGVIPSGTSTTTPVITNVSSTTICGPLIPRSILPPVSTAILSSSSSLPLTTTPTLSTVCPTATSTNIATPTFLKTITLAERKFDLNKTTATLSNTPPNQLHHHSIQIKSNTTLTPQQQQQIIQTIKQKILPQQQGQQIILKHHPTKLSTVPVKNVPPQGTTPTITLTSSAASILIPPKLATMSDGTKNTVLTGQNSPMLTKVLTNAAGQLISVESLLAHQKQHGSLPHGTTLRVTGTKGGPTSIIQLSNAPTSTSHSATTITVPVIGCSNAVTTTNANNISPGKGSGTVPTANLQHAHFTMTNCGAQPNLFTIGGGGGNQPKIVVASMAPSPIGTTHTSRVHNNTFVATNPLVSNAQRFQTTTTSTTITTTPTATTPTKQTSQQKFTQQLINAKLITAHTVDGQQKLFINSHHPHGCSSESPAGSTTTATTTTSTFKLATLQPTMKNIAFGKPVTLTTPTGTSTIRMLNATNLGNLAAHLAGKPIILASAAKVPTSVNVTSTAFGTKNATAVGGGLGTPIKIYQQAVASNSANATAGGNSSATGMVFATTKQPHGLLVEGAAPTVSIRPNSGGSGSSMASPGPRLLFTTTSPAHASSGGVVGHTAPAVGISTPSGGQIVTQQIILPAGFQGTTINLKTLQGVKVIPIGQNRVVTAGRQVFARVVNPSLIKTQQSAAGGTNQLGSASTVTLSPTSAHQMTLTALNTPTAISATPPICTCGTTTQPQYVTATTSSTSVTPTPPSVTIANTTPTNSTNSSIT